MHSLKNTIVAVGLLGLSFLFYQASSTPTPENAELFAPGDTLKSLDLAFDSKSNSADRPSSKLGKLSPAGSTPKVGFSIGLPEEPRKADSANLSPPKIELPEVSVPGVDLSTPPSAKPTPSFPASPSFPGNSQPDQRRGLDNRLSPPAEHTAPESSSPAEDQFSGSPLVGNAPPNFPAGKAGANSVSSPPSDDPGKSKADTNTAGVDFSAPNQPATSSDQSMEREQLAPSREARDDGLIAALQAQPSFGAAATGTAGSGSPNASGSDASAKQQAWQKNSFSQMSPEASIPTQPVGFGGFQPNQAMADSTSVESEAGFVSQPIATADSSFNQMASNTEAVDAVNRTVVSSPSASGSSATIQAAWPEVDRLVAAEDFLGALRLLSGFYRDANLTGPQRQKLMGFLDGLAGKVIFSQEHHLASVPYTVTNETLKDIEQRWNVPAQLIYNINQANIENPSALPAGTELKQVKGPFQAEISLSSGTMTLFLNELYAGRYPVRIGISGQPRAGDFHVLFKAAEGHKWRDAENKTYDIGAPENGYGPFWIGLTGQLCIHAIPDSAKHGHHGCIGLSMQDAQDIFGILSKGSEIRIVQ